MTINTTSTKGKNESSVPENFVNVYLASLRNYPLISAEDEKRLSKRILLGKMLDTAKPNLISQITENEEQDFQKLLDQAKTYISKTSAKTCFDKISNGENISTSELLDQEFNKYFSDSSKHEHFHEFNEEEYAKKYNSYALSFMLSTDEKHQKMAQESDIIKLQLKQLAEDAIHTLTESNLRIVVKIAKEFYPTSSNLLDFIQAGNMGLLNAIHRFNYHKNVKLITYAVKYIQLEIRAEQSSDIPIKIPPYILSKLRIVNAIIQKYHDQEGQNPDDKYILDATGVTPNELERIKQLTLSMSSVSLDATVTEDEKMTLGEILEDENSPQIHESVERSIIYESLEKELPILLPPDEEEIIRYRFGCNEEHIEYSLEEIAQKKNLSVYLIRTIESKALNRLRRQLICKKQLG